MKSLQKDITVPVVDFSGAISDDLAAKSLSDDYRWLDHVMHAVDVGLTVEANSCISWSAYHANRQSAVIQATSIDCLLPLFHDNAHSVAMICHAMTIICNAVNCLNPGQTPVVTLDQPLYALAKQVQWNWPAQFGEQHFVVLLGGLHTEMAALRTLGDWLDGSGWSAALVQANVTSPGKAEAMLHASHVKRTRHAHQVTAACLYILQQRAYRQYVSSAPTAEPLEFSAWCDDQANCHPQFQYWSLTLQFQLIVLLHLKAIRQSNFQLYISSLTQLIPLFFALDHHHYARWASVHLRDMTALSTLHPDVAAEFESGRFTTHKSKRPFSAIALDQGHEQLNAHVKSVGGAVGLLDNSDALLRWMVAGPEVARIIGEFESSMSSKCETSDDLVHLEQTLSVQHKFSEQLKSLVNCFEEMGNPFLDETDVVSAIDTKNVCGPAVTETVRSVISRGREQHRLFTEERLISCTQAVTAPLARNRLALFRSSSAVAKRDVTKSKLTTVRNDCALFSRLYIACQTRDGNLEDFFTHENQPFPPSLSSGGELRFGTKSDLLTCLEKIAPSSQESPNVDTLVLDGAAVAQMLQPINCKTFEQYAVDIFLPYVRSQLHSVGRLDVIWDRYIAGSLKASARQKRGMGLRRHVLPSVAVPRNWAQFLHDSENKKELFSFLSSYVMADTNLPLSKHVFATDDCHVLCHPSTTQCSGLQPCSHEEADTRIMLHVAHAAQSGFNRVMIRTVDTDVVVLATALWYHLHLAELWVAFGTGRNYRYLPVHTLAVSLGVDRCMALPFFHAFTGCDAVSSFAGHGKKSAWDTWNSYPDCTETFKYLSLAPATITDCLPTLERFVTLLYERGSNKTSVNSARKHLFTKKGRSMEALPPTQAALVEHTKRAVYQAGYCWCRSLDLDQNLPCPSQWGWVKDTSVGEWTPLWTSLPEVSKCCPELVSCKCKKGCTKRCKCVKAALKCTSLCLCDGCTDA